MKGIFMKKLLRITVRGETIIAHGRVVRTPVDIKLTDDEFSNIKLQLRSKGITDEHYSFGPIVVKDKKPIVKDITQNDKEPVVEEIKLPEDLSYLERLALK
jgi:hypothetical protein